MFESHFAYFRTASWRPFEPVGFVQRCSAHTNREGLKILHLVLHSWLSPTPYGTCRPRSARTSKPHRLQGGKRLDSLTRSFAKRRRSRRKGQGTDLGGNVSKKRLDEEQVWRHRCTHKVGVRSDFRLSVCKNDREDIEKDELRAFKKLAKDYGKLKPDEIDRLVKTGSYSRFAMAAKRFKSDAFEAIHSVRLVSSTSKLMTDNDARYDELVEEPPHFDGQDIVLIRRAAR